MGTKLNKHADWRVIILGCACQEPKRLSWSRTNFLFDINFLKIHTENPVNAFNLFGCQSKSAYLSHTITGLLLCDVLFWPPTSQDSQDRHHWILIVSPIQQKNETKRRDAKIN